MKRIVRAAVAFAVLTVAAGCGSVNQKFAEGVEGYTKEILPEYEAYVKADTKIKEDTRKIRLDSAAGLRRLIETAKENK
jgi:hypothetical protein